MDHRVSLSKRRPFPRAEEGGERGGEQGGDAEGEGGRAFELHNATVTKASMASAMVYFV